MGKVGKIKRPGFIQKVERKTDFQKDRLFPGVYVLDQDKRLITMKNQLQKIHVEMISKQRLTTKTNSAELY